MTIDEAIEHLGTDRVNSILDMSAEELEPASHVFAALARPGGLGFPAIPPTPLDQSAYWALASADLGAVRLAATPQQELEDACREGSETACAELDRRGIEPPLLEVDHADLPITGLRDLDVDAAVRGIDALNAEIELEQWRDREREEELRCFDKTRSGDLDAALGEGRR